MPWLFCLPRNNADRLLPPADKWLKAADWYQQSAAFIDSPCGGCAVVASIWYLDSQQSKVIGFRLQGCCADNPVVGARRTLRVVPNVQGNAASA